MSRKTLLQAQQRCLEVKPIIALLSRVFCSFPAVLADLDIGHRGVRFMNDFYITKCFWAYYRIIGS